MAGPGDPLGPDHAFADRAQLRHCGLTATIATVDPKLDAAEPAIDGAADHQILDPAIEAGAAQRRHIIGIADLEHAATRLDSEIAAHPGEPVAIEDRETPPVRPRQQF